MLRTALLLTFACLLAGCGTPNGDAAGLKVVATTPVVADLVKAVAGDRVQVTTLIPTNADPHEYEPRPRDIAALAEAKLVVRSGGDLDHWLTDALGAAGGDATQLNLLDHVDRHGEDPHWWHDPRNARKAVAAIRDALGKADAAGASAYTAAAASFDAKLQDLDATVARCVASVARGKRKLVTSHDALGYWARRYGYVVLGTVIPSLSTQSQPSAGQTAALVRLLRAMKVDVIFAETSVNPKVEAAIAREAGARVGPRLYADGLGPAGSPGATYLGAELANARAITGGRCK
jgi:ABC-type Zn uptake system ZnuABC Zn-binding protein ZnuA